MMDQLITSHDALLEMSIVSDGNHYGDHFVWVFSHMDRVESFLEGDIWGLRRNFIPLSVNTLYLNILLKNIYICMWSIVIYYIIYIFIQNVYKFWLLTSTLLIKHLITKRKNHCILQIINPFQFSLFSYDVCSGTLKWLVVLISAFPWHR
jgi:hypothetical protein